MRSGRIGIAIFVIFAASLHFLMSVGGLASFGHAAYFGLGAYGVASRVKHAGPADDSRALRSVRCSACSARRCLGFFAVRLSGVYFAMLTLAFAQIVWSVAFQWVRSPAATTAFSASGRAAGRRAPAHFYWLSLGVVVLLRSRASAMIIFSPFGYALRAARDSELRAEAIGIDGKRVQWTRFRDRGRVRGTWRARLFAYLKGSVFPDSIGISAVGRWAGDGAARRRRDRGPDARRRRARSTRRSSIWLISHTD